MLCQSCQKFEASVHQVQVKYLENDTPSVSEEHLCTQCAQAKGLRFAEPSNFADVVQKLSKGLLGPLQQLGASAAPTSTSTTENPCPECGWTERDFRQTSRFGCAHDYEHFSEFVDEVLERIHGFTEHAAPEQEGRIEQLRADLDSAILAEDYETAALMRDAIRDLESSLEPTDEPEDSGSSRP